MQKMITMNLLFVSKETLSREPFNYAYPEKKIQSLKKERLLFQISRWLYLLIPVLQKYIMLYWHAVTWSLILNWEWYVGLFTAAKRWWIVKQENWNRFEYIWNIKTKKSYKYYYDKMNSDNIDIHAMYNNALSFWLIYDKDFVAWSDREKTVLDLLYYSIYSKYISIDIHSLEPTVFFDMNTIMNYIGFYPKNSQKALYNKFISIYPNYSK